MSILIQRNWKWNMHEGSKVVIILKVTKQKEKLKGNIDLQILSFWKVMVKMTRRKSVISGHAATDIIFCGTGWTNYYRDKLQGINFSESLYILHLCAFIRAVVQWFSCNTSSVHLTATAPPSSCFPRLKIKVVTHRRQRKRERNVVWISERRGAAPWPLGVNLRWGLQGFWMRFGVYRAPLKGGPQFVWMLQAKPGRSGKQEQ